jgi:hypothetical protein
MPDGENPSWYSVAKKESPLEQGDILFEITIPTFVRENGEIKMSELLSNFVVINQSCDLIAQPGKPKPRAEHVLLAEAIISTYEPKNHTEIYTGRKQGFYILPRNKVNKNPKKHLIVNFNKLHAIHADLLPDLPKIKRMRMRSPYREHLIQAFSITYSRIALDELPLLT